MDIARRGLDDPGRDFRRGGEKEKKKIAGGGLLGQEESTLSRNKAAGRHGKAAHGGLLSGRCDALHAAPKLPGNVDSDGRKETDPIGSCGGPGCPGFFGVGLEAGEILADVERIEEGILIAIGALERAIDHLAITRQAALDMMEE